MLVMTIKKQIPNLQTKTHKQSAHFLQNKPKKNTNNTNKQQF